MPLFVKKTEIFVKSNKTSVFLHKSGHIFLVQTLIFVNILLFILLFNLKRSKIRTVRYIINSVLKERRKTMTKIKRTALFSALISVILGALVVLGVLYPSDDTRNERSEAELSLRLMSEEMVDIAVDADSPFELVYSSDANQGDSALATELRSLLRKSGKIFRPVPDTKEETEFEILLGNTNREVSQMMLAAINAYGSPDEILVWGYAYRNGKLVYVANSNAAFELGKEDFLALVAEDGTLRVPADLWVVNSMTVEEYEEMLREQEEAERQEIINALIEKNELFKNEERLTTGYVSMIGENGHYDKNPYQSPWVYPASNQHPRYLITEENVKRILEMQDDPEYKAVFDNLWYWAEYDIKEGIFPERTGGSGQINRYDERIITGISARAMAYLLTGDEIYAYEAIIAVKNAMLTLNFTTDIHMDVYHGASHVMVVLAAVYDWCYDVLTEDDKWQMITGSTTCLWPTMEFNYPPNDYNGISGHGTGPQLLRDYMSLAVAFYDEAPDWWEFVMGRYFQEYLPVANQQYVNGWISQGTACYAPIKLMVQLWAAHLIKTCTGENFFISDAALSVQLFVSQLQPNGKYFQTGDGGRTATGAAPGFAEYFVSAALYNDPLALAWAKYFTNDYTKVNTGSIFTMGADFQLAFISWVTNENVDKYEGIGRVQYFLDPAGQMTVRDSWDSDAAAVFMKVGNMSMSNHDVYEHGTFQIYYKGLLAADSGSYKHYGGDSHYYYLQCTVAHNGLLIFNPAKAADAKMDGNKVTNPGSYYYSGSQHRLPSPVSLQQWNDGTYRMAETTGWGWGYDLDGSVRYAYLAGDITDAYDDVTVDYVGRRMLTVYTGDEEIPMVFITFDELVSDEDYFEKTFLLHTVKEPEVDEENMTATVTEGEGRLVMASLFGADVIEKIGGEGKAYWINGYYKEDGTYVEGKNCLDEYTPDDNYMNIWGRVQLRARGDKTTNFLTAMYVSDADSTAELEISKFQNEQVYGASFGSNVTVFAAGREKTYKSFSFETEGQGLYTYYVSGIADGTWQIKVDGVSVAYALSADEAGLITFTAPAGKVDVVPGKDVIGANGGRIQYSTGGAQLPDDAPYSYNNEEATPLPEIAYRGEDVFLGWYLTSECLPEDRIYEVPAGTTGTFRVYAKWLATFINEDYTETVVNCKQGNVVLNGITYAGSGKAGSSFITKKDDDDRVYLEWIEGSSDSFIHAQNTAVNMSTAVSEDKSISFTVEIDANEGSPNLVSSFQMVAKVDVNGGAISSRHTHLFRTDTKGNVLLGGTKNIGNLTDEGTVTIRFAIDFAYGQIKAYDADNQLIASVAFRPDSALGTTSTEESMKCYTQYLFYWHGDTSKDISDATMRIYKVKMQDGNVFELSGGDVGANGIKYNKNGGSLPKGTPYQYSKEEPTVLPTDVTRDGYIFGGWFTTETFDEGTRTYYVPTDTEGAYEVYAKWIFLAVDETYDGKSFEIKESTSGSNGTLSYNAGSAGEPKPGSGFVTVTDGNNTYLKASVGSVNSIIYHSNNNYNLTHFTETSISYAFDMKKLEGVDFPNVILQIATSGGKYGSLRIMTIDEAGNAKLEGSSNVFAKVTEQEYTTFRITLDFADASVTAYDSEGNAIDSVKLKGVPGGSGGTPASLLEWQKVAASYLAYFALSRTNKTEGAVSSFAIDNIKVAEGNIFLSEEVILPVGNGIIYKLDGGRLPEGAPKEYDPQNGTLLPTATRPGYIFGGWYTSETLSDDTRVYYVPFGTEGSFAVYAKWLTVLGDETYEGKDFTITGQTANNAPYAYNAVNSGVSHQTVIDEQGNTYVKSSFTDTKNGVIYQSSNSYNFTNFRETAVSYQVDLRKLAGVSLSAAAISIQTAGAAAGSTNLVSAGKDGAVRLAGSSLVFATVGEEGFTTLRITVDFADGMIYAYDSEYNVLDSVAIKVPTGYGVTTAAEWQKIAKTYTFYMSLSGKDTAIGVDNIKVVEGRAFEKTDVVIPSRTGIDYVLGGGTLPEGAPTEYDPTLGTLLPTTANKNGYAFAGWYTSADFSADSRVYYVPAGTEGTFTVYAKWFTVLTDESYTGKDIFADAGQPVIDGIAYNAMNAGVSVKTETDESGNTYLRVNNEIGGQNAVIRTTDSAYNISTFAENAVSFEMSFSKAVGIELSNARWLLQSSSSAGGSGELVILTSNAAGELFLCGTELIGNITEGAFTKVKLGVDFTAGTVSAFDENNEIIASISPKAPAGFASLAEWQRAENGLKNHILFMSVANSFGADSTVATALLIDDIKIADGFMFEKKDVKLPSITGIEYVTGGGKLPEGAPEEYNPEDGLVLPTPVRSGYVFAGWYTSSDFADGTEIQYIPIGHNGNVKVYAKWYTVMTEEDYKGDDFFADEGQPERDGIAYNVMNAGVSVKTETDESGNTYLRVNNEIGGQNAVIRTTDAAYNINTMDEDAISFEISFSKLAGVELPRFDWILQSSSGVGGTGLLRIVEMNTDGEIRLTGSSAPIATVTEGAFVKVKICVDFAAGTVTAYGANNEVIETVSPAAPEGFSSLAEWQRADNGLKHHILFLSILNPGAADSGIATGLLIDDIKIVDGMAFVKTVTSVPSNNFIEYVTGGGKLPEGAPTEYDSETGLVLPAPTRPGSTFAGWYTTKDYEDGSRITEIEAGKKGVVKVYAKWLGIVADNDYTYDDFLFNERKQNYSNGFNYNTLNPGVSMMTETDENGDVYVRVENAEATINDGVAKNGVIYYTSSSYNLTHFTETAISYQFDLAKIPAVPLSSLALSIQTSGGAYGGFRILYVKEKTGEIILGKEPELPEGEEVDFDAPPAEGQIVVGKVTEDGFTTIRVTVDFEAATITAYGEGGTVLGEIAIESVPSGTSGAPETMLDWQKVAAPYVFYASIVRNDQSTENSGILFDDLIITEGRAF